MPSREQVAAPPSSQAMTRPLALTLGEPAGIGPDITLMSWLRRRQENLPPFYVVGDASALTRRARQLGVEVAVAEVDATEVVGTFAQALPVVGTCAPANADAGRPDATSARAAIVSIEHAVADVRAGRAAAVVTNPVAKHVLYGAGFKHPGHTEFLAELAADGGPPPHPVMMLWSEVLAVVPVTIHLALRDAIQTVTTGLIVDTCRITEAALRTRFGVARPRLAIAGLNPHAGEGGTLGSEDDAIVAPAVSALRASGFDVRGPLPADTMFHAAARATYDCAVCMYHDQALIPIKTVAFDDAVNVTLGLPFVRTSPDHGTAFDIAGTGRASPSSLIAALKLAARMTSAVPAVA
jgi:4-hydroxythreonine-4-phosphate dehydrogenase